MSSRHSIIDFIKGKYRRNEAQDSQSAASKTSPPNDPQGVTASKSPENDPRSAIDIIKGILLRTDWDEGVFSSELLRNQIAPRDISAADTHRAITPPKDVGKPAPLTSGTYRGTKLALTQMSKRIEKRFESFFEVAGFETSIPLNLNTSAQQLYTYQKPQSDNYPPHLDIIPKVDQVSLLQIFDFMRLLDTGTLIGTIIPDEILDFIHDHPQGATIAKIEERNNELHKDEEDIFTEDNIGNRSDWYTDRVFSQQQFVGPNPTTIEKASPFWIKSFAEAAQGNKEMYALLSSSSTDSFYVQDCSYFRSAIGAGNSEAVKSTNGTKYLCASVTLFHLSDKGDLHPLAIIVDYKGNMKDSVVIFNKRGPGSILPEKKDDWPWRYAKTCAQISDWNRHEIAIHLVNCHLVEEAVIVATHRSFPTTHPVFRLLQPHWLKTLSINAAARSSLVPNVIAKLVGMTDKQMYAFINASYRMFDWTARYVPNDLNSRGFPVDQLASNKKFHNYAYGRNMILMWQVLRKYVAAVVDIDIHSDDDVIKDTQIKAWSDEMRSDTGGQLKLFPEIKTKAQLIDAVTMCIHIASPQHTAVNYLQSYYQTFVINKPPALYAPPPKTIDELKGYKEQSLLDALPLKFPREWLLASHVPHLLSYRVAEDQNLINFALSTAKLASQSGQDKLATAAAQLYADLLVLVDVFKAHSKEMDDQKKVYDVMDPKVTAVSILL